MTKSKGCDSPFKVFSFLLKVQNQQVSLAGFDLLAGSQPKTPFIPRVLGYKRNHMKFVPTRSLE